jgi:hypothetical protein
MLNDVVEVRHLGGHRLYLRFEDGIEGEVDLKQVIRFTGVFAPLETEAEFARVQLDPESGTITWPTGADVDPDVLYAVVSGTPIAFPRQHGSPH